MRFLVLSIALIFCASFIFKQDDSKDDAILWNKNRALTWDDYQGTPKRRFAAASTVYSVSHYLTKEKNNTIFAHVETYFYRNDSWKKGNWIDDALLKHEQKHFDIAELYARKFRKQLSELVYINYDDAQQKLDSLYHIMDVDMDAYQDKYDDETNGSMSHDAQQSWIKSVNAQIETLNGYENTSVPLKMK